ncbi:hypothetical protein HELRODRAFT_169488 [Helobdella robusta]|uniref:WSC domain-containing protein n=1 Tax=Helobdella robusta TaxID=6412 RepID=T1F202_HELRO|nr:hypothetical protein HELRODRAFT_169488 [Helobdella robusta]ESO08609.1 hypothetical protein HELRODRAFT_169488 [Helobdella robusta]
MIFFRGKRFLYRVILLHVLFVQVNNTKYKYLGCYTASRDGVGDLSGMSWYQKDFKVENCIGSCQSKGYPYAGGQLGATCSCGSTYGQLGKSIYQTLNYSRIYKFYNDAKIFDEARKTCVISNGEIPSLDTSDKTSALLLAVQDATANSYNNSLFVWLGLKRRLIGQSLEWTDAYLKDYDLTSSDSGNQTGDQQQDSSSNDILDSASDPIVLYIVLPLFALCYGGSCVAFCAYKIYINCFDIRKKKKPQKIEVSKVTTETIRRKMSTIYRDYKLDDLEPCCSSSLTDAPLISKKSVDYLAPPMHTPFSKSFTKSFAEFQPHKYFGSVSKEDKLENEQISKISKSAFFNPKRLTKLKIGMIDDVIKSSSGFNTEKNFKEQHPNSSKARDESLFMHDYLKQQERSQLEKHLKKSKFPKSTEKNVSDVAKHQLMAPGQWEQDSFAQQKEQQHLIPQNEGVAISEILKNKMKRQMVLKKLRIFEKK